MKAKGIAVRLAVTGAGALLPLLATAQVYRPEGVEDLMIEPAVSLSLSQASIDAIRRDGVTLNSFSFAKGKVGADRLSQPGSESPGPWIVYARVYVLNYQGNVSETRFGFTEQRIGFARTGPAIAGRIYIGIRKRF